MKYKIFFGFFAFFLIVVEEQLQTGLIILGIFLSMILFPIMLKREIKKNQSYGEFIEKNDSIIINGLDYELIFQKTNKSIEWIDKDTIGFFCLTFVICKRTK